MRATGKVAGRRAVYIGGCLGDGHGVLYWAKCCACRRGKKFQHHTPRFMLILTLSSA